MPSLINHWDYMYGDGNIIDYGLTRRITQWSGNVQGCMSSVYLYALTKKVVLDAARERMENKDPAFRLIGICDYVDDGLECMKLKYVRDYIDIVQDEYARRGLSLNRKKTRIIINNQSDNALDYIIKNLKEFKINIMGCYTFLNIPQGKRWYINKLWIEKLIKLETKLRTVELIRDKQVAYIISKTLIIISDLFNKEYLCLP